MVTATVQGSNAGGHVADVVPDAAARLAQGQLGSRAEVEAELDHIIGELRKTWEYQPDLTMRLCAALSSRLTELTVTLHRAEGRDRVWKTVRTMQVRPILEEIDRQYKLASRIVEIQRQDLALLGGSNR